MLSACCSISVFKFFLTSKPSLKISVVHRVAFLRFFVFHLLPYRLQLCFLLLVHILRFFRLLLGFP